VKNQTIRYGATLVFVLLTIALAGCGEKLPSDAKTAILSAFEPGEKARIHSAQRAEPLQEDLAMDAQEVWCVNLTFACWSCGHGEWRTCADSRLVRRIGDDWQVSLVVTDEDEEKWEARGCELMPDLVSGY
jgi:predicted small lipoprotein YifL